MSFNQKNTSPQPEDKNIPITGGRDVEGAVDEGQSLSVSPVTFTGPPAQRNNYMDPRYMQNMHVMPAYAPQTPQFNNNYGHYGYGVAQNNQHAVPFPPPGLPHPPASRHLANETMYTPTPARARKPVPNFTLPTDFGMSFEQPTPYNPPLSPPPIGSDSDNLPEPGEVALKTKGKKTSKQEKDQKTTTDTKAEKSGDTKKPARKKVKVEEKEKEAKRTKGGRQAGTRNFSSEEQLHVLKYVNERLPIGGSGWQDVAEEYNKWAGAHKYVERDQKSLKAKYEALVRTAKNKPTGCADRDPRTDPLALALKVEEAIEEKAGTLTLDDEEFDDGDQSSVNSVIELSDNEETLKKASKTRGEKSSKGKEKDNKDTVLTKAYQSSKPLDDTQRRRPRHATATEALTSITNMFDPAALRDRDELRMSQTLQLSQLSGLQQQTQELRARIDALTDRLMEETRRADRAESQVQLLNTLHQSRSRRQRRRSYSTSDSEGSQLSNFDSPRPRRHRRSRWRLRQSEPDNRRTRHNVQMTSVHGYEDGPLRFEHRERRRDVSQASMSQASEPFFGRQPPSSSNPEPRSPPTAGPSVFPGSLNVHEDTPPLGGITLTPRRRQDGALSFDIEPKT